MDLKSICLAAGVTLVCVLLTKSGRAALGNVFSKVTSGASATVAAATTSKPSTSSIVAEWESFYATLKTSGNTKGMELMHDIFPTLAPHDEPTKGVVHEETVATLDKE